MTTQGELRQWCVEKALQLCLTLKADRTMYIDDVIEITKKIEAYITEVEKPTTNTLYAPDYRPDEQHSRTTV